jgi:hypothetical protein
MPKKRCGLGFDCASMMLQPGLDAGECENYATCGSATQLTPEEEFELIRWREEQARETQERLERYRETIRVNRHDCALMMLISRGCPQTPESFGVLDLLNQVATKIEEVRSQITHFQGQYIAPEKCEAHTYNVKRPKGVYCYNKLTAAEAIFQPSEKSQKVRVIHLSHDQDPRNSEARLGIQRRNTLTQARTQINAAHLALTLALELLESSSIINNQPARTVGELPPPDEPNPV